MGGRQGQAWSVDLIIGVLIFLVAIGAIYSIMTSKAKNDPEPLRIESEVIATILTSNASNELLQVANGNQLNMNSLFALASEASGGNYAQLKQQLGIKNDFCIYLQDEDGNLVYIADEDGTTRYSGIGPGKDDLKISGVPCGAPATAS